MSKEYLDENGLSHFFSKIKAFFVKKSGDTMSGSLATGGQIMVGDKRGWTDTNSGVYIATGGFISMRGMDTTTPGLYVTAYGSTSSTYDAGLYYNATNDRWQSNKQIYAPSFYATGRVDVGTTSVTGSSTIHAITQGREIELITQATGTCGLYDITNSKWIAYMSSSGVRGPAASTTEVGFMSVADKTKLDGLGVTGMAASGPSTAISVPTGTATDLLTTAISLAANHKYLLTYVVQWATSATGLRATSVTIGGSSIGVISQDQRQAVSGGVTYNNGTVWIQPSSSARTCMIRGTQTSGGNLNATARYQLIDFGT